MAECDEERDLHRAFSRLEWLERNQVQNQVLTTALADLRSKLPQKLFTGSTLTRVAIAIHAANAHTSQKSTDARGRYLASRIARMT